MGIAIEVCPHCGTQHVIFDVIAAKVVPRCTDDVGYHFGSAAAVCSRCGMVIALTIVNERPALHSTMVSLMAQLLSEPPSAQATGLQIETIDPVPRSVAVPAHLSVVVERFMLQAERIYRMEGAEEAAAVMYCRSLDRALQERFPGADGPFAKRMKQLVATAILPSWVSEWAAETGLIGDDMERALDGVDRNQLRILRGFTNAVLRHLQPRPADENRVES